MDSFHDYLHDELRRGYELGNDEKRYTERRKKFYTFLKVPYEFEKFMVKAYVQILDSFLFVFTLLPIRFLLSCWFLVWRSIWRIISKFFLHQRHAGMGPAISSSRYGTSLLQPAEMCDLLRGIILVSATLVMSYVDTSALYHMVKTQSVIKLYVGYNILEVVDKLSSTSACDVLDALFWTATEPIKTDDVDRRRRRRYSIVFHLLGSILCVLFQSHLFLLQATVLNVALNSKNDSLLTIMMSNNFVELKGMVFKKFERNNLFHMSCSDVRERHHILVLLIIVMIQTLKEYSWDESQFFVLLPNCILILVTEMVVDWFKHAFVTRFNEMTSEVYQEYSITLAYDAVNCRLNRAHSDHSDVISHRMGFIPISLAVLVLRVFAISLKINWWEGYFCLLLGYLCLLTWKIWINIMMVGQAWCSTGLANLQEQQSKLTNQLRHFHLQDQQANKSGQMSNQCKTFDDGREFIKSSSLANPQPNQQRAEITLPDEDSSPLSGDEIKKKI